jgi:trans-aconitate methyltransferase
MTIRVFRDEPLLNIVAFLWRCLADGAPIEIAVLDPDLGRARYAGEWVEGHLHRPFRVWVDLAERLGLRLLTPRPGEPPLVELRFEPLARGSAARGEPTEPSERYGAASEFARVDKREDPGFVLDLADALDRVALGPAPRILDLGVNTGDELALIMELAPRPDATFVAIDHSASALAVARQRFGERVQLIEADLNQLGELGLGRFDLVVAIGTLQSAGIDDRALVRRVVQDHLAPAGAVIFGIPNCRYVDGEIEYGARMKNFRQPELGLVIKDIAFYRKYLQQHHRHVFVTGKNYLLVTAIAYPAQGMIAPYSGGE